MRFLSSLSVGRGALQPPRVPMPGYGRMNCPAVAAAIDSNAGLKPNVLYIVPFVVLPQLPATLGNNAIAVSSLGLNVAQAAAGCAAILAVYGSGANGMPTGAPVLANNTGIALTSVGDLSLPVSGNLTPGLYWAAVIFTNAGQQAAVTVLGAVAYTWGFGGAITFQPTSAAGGLALGQSYAAGFPTLTGSEVWGPMDGSETFSGLSGGAPLLSLG